MSIELAVAVAGKTLAEHAAAAGTAGVARL
jgi:hypothetical protein